MRSAAPTTAPSTRYATLDAWRGFACLLVVVYHSTLFQVHAPPRGDGGVGEALLAITGRMSFGVIMFFVISGYCIAAAAQAASDRPAGTGRYFARRFRRIYPPYWAAVALALTGALVLERTVAAGLVDFSHPLIVPVPDPGRVAPAHWVGGLTLTETWRPLVAGSPPELQLLGPAWTLCYEEQFYLVTGLLLLVARRRFFAAVAVLSAAVFAGVVLEWGGMAVKGTFLDGRWLMFAAGAGVFWAANRGGRLGGAAVVLATLAVAAYAGREPAQQYQSALADGKELLGACLFALLLLRAHRWDAQTAQCRIGRRLAAVGRYSYSLYLVHYPICLAVGHAAYRAGFTGPWETLLLVVPACVGLSVLAGRAFYRAVESRFVPGSQEAAPARTPAHPPRDSRQAPVLSAPPAHFSNIS
jgi:peptidoglycan/LPS O-acetylase OafA/YrhL